MKLKKSTKLSIGKVEGCLRTHHSLNKLFTSKHVAYGDSLYRLLAYTQKKLFSNNLIIFTKKKKA